MRLNSCGCDAGSEVALYDVYFEEFRGNDLITSKNSPRPGRSGGDYLQMMDIMLLLVGELPSQMVAELGILRH